MNGLNRQKYNFRNIVSTVNLGCKLDLKKIALHARNAEYNPKVIWGVYCSLVERWFQPNAGVRLWCITEYLKVLYSRVFKSWVRNY